MTIEQFSVKWFTSYYFVLGLSFVVSGIVMMAKLDFCTEYILSEMETDAPPDFLRTILKYFFIFTIPGLVLSFVPFIWYELLFAVWSLCMIFVIGLRLVRWPQTRLILKSDLPKMQHLTKLAGIALIVIGLVVILLGFQELQRLFFV